MYILILSRYFRCINALKYLGTGSTQDSSHLTYSLGSGRIINQNEFEKMSVENTNSDVWDVIVIGTDDLKRYCLTPAWNISFCGLYSCSCLPCYYFIDSKFERTFIPLVLYEVFTTLNFRLEYTPFRSCNWILGLCFGILTCWKNWRVYWAYIQSLSSGYNDYICYNTWLLIKCWTWQNPRFSIG